MHCCQVSSTCHCGCQIVVSCLASHTQVGSETSCSRSFIYSVGNDLHLFDATRRSAARFTIHTFAPMSFVISTSFFPFIPFLFSCFFPPLLVLMYFLKKKASTAPSFSHESPVICPSQSFKVQRLFYLCFDIRVCYLFGNGIQDVFVCRKYLNRSCL